MLGKRKVSAPYEVAGICITGINIPSYMSIGEYYNAVLAHKAKARKPYEQSHFVILDLQNYVHSFQLN